jgi:PIN domain nuclease of toxin-antitoxin system
MVLDTHALIWFLLEPGQLSTNAANSLRAATDAGEQLCLSAISLVEICYLEEKGRLPDGVSRHVNAALDAESPALVTYPVDLEVARAVPAIPRDTVPDMPDRIIAATALHLDLPLVTRDAQIRAAGIETIW